MASPTASKTLVTMALPYANGSIHLGHLVEAVQTDVYVRALKAAGREAIYLCADDTHGTPIQVSAAKAGVTPEQFVARFHEEHQRDYAAFGIAFDEFYTTHSPENEKHAGAFFEALKAAGAIDLRPVEQLYCEVDQRFLPDRYVKGICPKCNTRDQYGDACEKCGSTYDPTDLLQPYCSLCRDQGRGEVPPVRRSSPHYFVRLSHYQEFLKRWTSTGTLQPEIRRSIDGWLAEPLRDWDISRDAPYFGFKIPGEDAKYFYVWLDAPIGYLSTTEHWAKKQVPPKDVEAYWARDADCDIVHFIGKDIVYFHTLFWPAMLEAAGRKLPARVHVHGMLTVEGTKMSKSRGTFINAREFLDAGLDPEWLRYFYAANLGTSPSDIDLSLTEMKNRVNGELLGNIGNLANRALSVVWKQFGGKLAKISGWDGGYLRGPKESPEKVTFTPTPAEIWEMAKTTEAEAIKGYLECDTRYAIQQIMVLSSMGNERLQRTQPWKLVLENPEAAQRELTLAVNIARVCARLLAPVVPAFAAGVAAQTNAPLQWGDWAFLEDHQLLAEPKPLVRRMEDADVLKLASRFVLDDPARGPRAANDAPKAKSADAKRGKAAEPKQGEEKPADTKASKARAAPPPEPPAEIAFDQFAVVDLRAGKVLACEKVVKSEKLLKLTIDLGEAAPRTIVSGIALHYTPEELVGKTVAVVANLAKRPLMKIESHGMVLAASGGAKGLTVLELPGDVAPGTRVK